MSVRLTINRHLFKMLTLFIIFVFEKMIVFNVIKFYDYQQLKCNMYDNINLFKIVLEIGRCTSKLSDRYIFLEDILVIDP